MRKLETYSKAVLIEYIRRLPVEPVELDDIEREVKHAPEPRVVICPLCNDGGAIIAPDVAAEWCTCAAADRLRAKDPKFVDGWNARWSRPENHSMLVRRKHVAREG